MNNKHNCMLNQVSFEYFKADTVPKGALEHDLSLRLPKNTRLKSPSLDTKLNSNILGTDSRRILTTILSIWQYPQQTETQSDKY